MAQQALTRQILRDAGHDQIAAGYDPFDPVGLAVASLIPAGFTAYGLRGQVKAARAKAAADFNAGPVPSEPTPVAAAVADAYKPALPRIPPEVVDAAMVQNTRDFAARQGTLADIPLAEALTPAERGIEDRLAAKVSGDFEAAAIEYAGRPDSRGGKVLNTDIARELSPDYLSDRTKSAAVHEPASWFIKRLYAEKLAGLKGDTVVFTSGGTGAGKTTGISDVPAARALVDDAGLVYDTNMNTLASSVKKIEQALDAGVAQVHILHVQRDPVEALVKGALPRAMRQEAEFGTGRTVPLVEHAKTHRGAAEVIQQLAEKYKDDPRVSVQIIDNTQGRGGARHADLGFIRGFDYNGLEGKLHEALKQEHDAGRISGAVFRATQGNAGEGIGAVLRSDVRGQHKPQRTGGSPSGQQKAGDPLARLNEPAGAAPKPAAEPIMSTVATRVADLETTAPDMVVRIADDGKHVTLADDLAEVRRMVAEGTDDSLGTLDADLIRVAVECALSTGG